MKKIILLFFVFVGFLSNAQNFDKNDSLRILDELGRVGIKTIEKDTLYLFNCKLGNDIKNMWQYVTKENLMADGIEKPPVFIMVNTITEFKTILNRIGKINSESCLKISNLQ